jgi:hypothetical protein
LAAIATPIAARTIWRITAIQSIPEVDDSPSIELTAEPAAAATVPTTIVSQIGIGWRPGRRAGRARRQRRR